MIRFLHILTVAALVALSSPNVLACSCGGGGGPACQEAWGDWVKAIFLARVIRIDHVRATMGPPEGALSVTPIGSTNRVTMEIEESYRGVSVKQVEVLTASSEAACGYSFQKGERYLVFGGMQGQQVGVSLCSATRPAKYAEEDISYLRSLASLPETARVYGNLKRYTYDPDFKPKFEPSIMDHYRPPEEEYRAMEPMAGTRVRVHASDGDHDALADSEGRWEVNGLPPGAYEITVDLPASIILDPALGIRGHLSPKGCSRVYLRAESNGHFRGNIVSAVPLSQYYLVQVGVFRAEDAEIDLIRPFRQVFPDWDSGNFDVGPLPPGRYYLAVIINNKDLDIASLFYPGVDNPGAAKNIKLGDGESQQHLNFTVGKPVFRERPSCCEFKIRVPRTN